MNKSISLGVALLIVLSSCSQTTRRAAQVEEDPFTICKETEFSGASRSVEFSFPVSNEPIMVRQIRGRIIYRNWEGSWQEGVWPILELRGPESSAKIHEFRCDSLGRFVIKDLPDGRYCFFASASEVGWQGAYGVIIIDRKADPRKEIEIVLGFGVP